MSVKEQYWRFSLVAIIIGLGLVLFMKITPFLGGILGAFTIYVLVRKQMIYLTEKKKIRPSFAAFLLLGETILFVLIPLSLIVWLIIVKLQNVTLDTGVIMDTAQHIADIVQEKTGYNILDRENLLNAVALLPKVGQSLVGSISGLSVNLVALIFVLYFMLISCRRMEIWCYSILPFSRRNKDRVVNEVYLLVKSNAIGIPLLALIQGVFALAGYYLFQVPQPFLFGFFTCIATIIPIVGTALVWFPLCIYMAITGDWVNALGLAIYALIVISNVDNLIRFTLQKQLANTHPLITIFGVIIGLSLFGFMGIIFGPILISVFLLCVNIFKEQYLDDKRGRLIPPRNTKERPSPD